MAPSNEAPLSTASTNGTNGVDGKHRFDPNLTPAVINSAGPNAHPRVKQLISGLVQHLHDFCRENEVTLNEYLMAIDVMNRAGKASTEKRNEGLLLLDILGLETLCDEITHTIASEKGEKPTETSILGPFWRKDAPIYKMGESIVKGFPDADHTFMHGRVVDFATGKPIENAELDVWHNGPNGLYEQQDPDQPDMNLRGRFYTGADGEYNFYCSRPISYSIPFDGPAGELLDLLDRHTYRPAHIHFILSAPGYKPIVTQIYDRADKNVENDVAFAVKDSLIVDFEPKEGDPKANFDLKYDFKLVSLKS